MVKNVFISLLLMASFLFQAGCASKGFNRGELKNQTGIIQPTFDDKEIEKAFAKKTNLPKHFKLGIYFKSPDNSKKWRWSEEDKEIFDQLAKDLKASGVVSEVFPIMSSLVPDDSNIKAIRYGAAKFQADAVLVITGAGEIDQYMNNWGLTYIAVLPTLFVKGTESETLFIANASLWDVRNEMLYLTAEAEATTKETYAAAFGPTDKQRLAEAKTQALKNLNVELKKMTAGVKL